MLELHVLGATELRRTDGTRVHSVLAQPKRLALLVYLLLSGRGAFVRRDSLLALFWPESDDAHARAALRKAIHYLRASLGPDVIVRRGNDEVAVDTARCDCDALRLRSHFEAGHLENAVGAYSGELLPGFHLDGAPAFEDWLEAERAMIRRLAADAAVTLARRADAAGDHQAAVAWQRRAHEIAPDDADIIREALVLLIAARQRSAALELLAAHRKRLADGGIPDDATLDELFARSGTPEASPVISDPQGTAAAATRRPATKPLASAPDVRSAAPVRFGSGVLRWLLPAAAAVAALLAVWQLAQRSDRRAAADGALPLVAIGAIRDFTADVDSVGRVIPDLLATNLARAPRLRVVSAARLHEIVATAGDGVRRPAAFAAAARAANARELVEGALYRLPDGQLRLDLRRLRLADGELLDTYRVTGSNPFELVDRATATLALDIGGVAGRGLRVSDVTTRSLVALRFYQEGLSAYFQGDADAADRMFRAALAEDTTFAMAAYFAAMANSANGPLRIRLLRRAERLAHRASERERLLIRGTLAHYMMVPEQTAIIDSLVRRYPDDPSSLLLYGRSLVTAGRFAEALVPLRRAVELDSLSLHRENGPCRACESLAVMGLTYLFMDSTSAAERVMRRAYEARRETQAYATPLVYALHANGKYAAADRILRRAGDGVVPSEHIVLGLIANDIRRGEFARADDALRNFIATSAPSYRSRGRWWLVISLRHQGRLDDALAVVEDERHERQGSSGFPPLDVLMAATIRFERGDYELSASLFDSIGNNVPRDGVTAWSRNTAWNLTHAANAYAAAGRLDVVARLADYVQEVGAGSGYGRDPRLHHHIRGLLAAARGDHRTAVDEFRAAIFSVACGYTRTNVELARSLLALGRPQEAIAVLDPPLRNAGLESMLYYATLTELRALLGEAYLRAGDEARAREHLDAALRALEHADPTLDELITRLRALRAEAA